MSDSLVKVGFLIPLKKDLREDESVLKVPVFEGDNAVGRNNLSFIDKRVSRHHITLHASKDGSTEVVVNVRGNSSRGNSDVIASADDAEAIRRFNVPKDKLPLVFRLMRVQGLPAWANTSSVAIDDVIQKNKPQNWIFHKPPLPISYGTHHSKAMLLVYPQGVRIIIHTANLIYVDWNNKTQGLWMQDFPWKDEQNLSKGCSFESDLVDYLNALKWPEFSVDIPRIGRSNINASFFKKFDYSSATVRLIASIPGYHTGSNLKKWGHMKLRTVLEQNIFDKQFCGSPLVYQFSSLGSLDEKWMAELALSMSSGSSDKKEPLGLGKPLIIWPTVEDVRCSLEGYAAGNAVPSPQKNVEKDFLKKYWARWKASHTGRCRAMPHIKTFARYNGQNLAWFLLTSANLSKAAWGALQKNNSQLMIRSYELGVLFMPSVIRDHRHEFSCTNGGGKALMSRGHGTGDIPKMTCMVRLGRVMFNCTQARIHDMKEHLRFCGAL
ncbi:hypothetical protein QJS04_geneDACA019126 [Acorus gramineus]|uniref:Tyrosyl-DNA phosphodiesterase 1 n=1 Tax=Acorus gramineus TaxID=55184 RepID=A0AAV9A7Y2_ACOGR|nr:hypothetical protein QJS04_geneDACA019126 [Acorus gramineus]